MFEDKFARKVKAQRLAKEQFRFDDSDDEGTDTESKGGNIVMPGRALTQEDEDDANDANNQPNAPTNKICR